MAGGCGGYLLGQRGGAAELLFVALRQEEEQRSEDGKHRAGGQVLLLHRS